MIVTTFSEDSKLIEIIFDNGMSVDIDVVSALQLVQVLSNMTDIVLMDNRREQESEILRDDRTKASALSWLTDINWGDASVNAKLWLHSHIMHYDYDLSDKHEIDIDTHLGLVIEKLPSNHVIFRFFSLSD